MSPAGVVAVAPGLMETEASNAALPQEQREMLQGGQMLSLHGTADDIVKLGLFLGSDDARFITAEVIGAANPQVFMVGNIIQRKFLDSLDYPAAAALAFVLVGAVMVLVTVYTRLVGSEQVA